MTAESIALYILPVLVIAIIFIFLRLVQGPSLPDRVVALDLLSSMGIVIMSTYAVATNQPLFLDVALVVALVSFLGTVAFAFYMSQRNYHRD